jgi:hypothetical protein
MPSNEPAPSPGPLERRLRDAAAESRRSFQAVEFSRDDYEQLLARAESLAQRLVGFGLSEAAVKAVHDRARVLDAVVRLLDDPAAGVVAPSNDQVYLAGLLVSRLDLAARNLTGAPKAWFEQFETLLSNLSDTGGATEAARRLTLIEFGGLCRRSGISCRPNAEPLAATLEIDDWSFAAAPEIADLPGSLSDAASNASNTLKVLKRPGLIVLDAGGAMPDAPALRRVGNDASAMIEMRRHVDQFIVENHEQLVAAVDTDFAFGAVISAVLHSVNVSTGRIAFASCARVVNLCDSEDPRAARLGVFMNRFG